MSNSIPERPQISEILNCLDRHVTQNSHPFSNFFWLREAIKKLEILENEELILENEAKEKRKIERKLAYEKNQIKMLERSARRAANDKAEAEKKAARIQKETSLILKIKKEKELKKSK